MIDKTDKVVIVGGGPAGLAAALGAREAGLGALVIDKGRELGGILNQCIHDGFGLKVFNESLTGPEYAWRFIEKVLKDKEIDLMPKSTVMKITDDRRVLVSNREGVAEIDARAIVLAMGCREKTREELRIPGTRPAGIYTAGVAQRLINLGNMMVGREAVILGSGDVGLIMARRLKLEGADVKCVVEILPYSSGLPRNIQQCLRDFDIPLLLKHTVTKISGRRRVKEVTVSKVDGEMNPIPKSEKKISCDTLLISAGLIPMNELSQKAGVKLSGITGGPMVDSNLETNIDGIFACGNVLHVHDLVDYATEEALKAGRNAAKLILGKLEGESETKTVPGNGVRYVLPQKINMQVPNQLCLRVEKPHRRKSIRVMTGNGELIEEKKFKGLHPANMVRIRVGEYLRSPDQIRLEVSP